MKQHGTEKERYYHTASAHHRHDTYHGIGETEGIEIYEICRTEEDADEDDSPMPAEGRSGVALGIPQNEHHNEHHEALIDVVPALHHHTVEPHSTFILRCHEVFVVESADSTEHSGKDDEIYPLVVFEVDALLLAASAEHEKDATASATPIH